MACEWGYFVDSTWKVVNIKETLANDTDGIEKEIGFEGTPDPATVPVPFPPADDVPSVGAASAFGAGRRAHQAFRCRLSGESSFRPHVWLG